MLEKFPDPFMAEICGQPAALRRAGEGLRRQLPALRDLPAAAAAGPIIFTGMGGSYAACYAPVTTLAAAGIAAGMVDSAELLYFRRETVVQASLLVVVSQSGESAEVVRLVEQLMAERERPFIVSISNGLGNRLASIADVALDSHAGTEQGPSTLTFGAALVALAGLAGILSGQSVDVIADRLVAESEGAAASIERSLTMTSDRTERIRCWLGDRPILTVLGRGAARAAAEMGALTLKEAARFPAEAMESGQFRHGPLELAGAQTAVVMVATEPVARDVDARLAADLVGSGAAVLFIANEPLQCDGVETIAVGRLERGLAPAAAIVPMQLLAWRLAVERGFNPGTYTRASKVTKHE